MKILVSGKKELINISDDPMTEEEKAIASRAYTWTCYSKLAKHCPWLSYLPFLPDKNSAKMDKDSEKEIV